MNSDALKDWDDVHSSLKGYTPGLVSYCTVTLDRYELTAKIVPQNLFRAGYKDIELLSVDNGSEDRRVPAFIGSMNPAYHRLNPTNEGYSPSLNQMLHRAKGEYICICDPDITLPHDWLNLLVQTNKQLRGWYGNEDSIKPGISGYWCVLDVYKPRVINGRTIYPGWNVFGLKFYHREILETAGWYPEDFGVYGNEDCDMNHRLNRLGYTNYYVPGSSEHSGDDVGDKSPYRKMKWDSLEYAGKVLTKHLAYYDETKNYYVPPPEKRFLAHPSHFIYHPTGELFGVEMVDECSYCHLQNWDLEQKCKLNTSFNYGQ